MTTTLYTVKNVPEEPLQKIPGSGLAAQRILSHIGQTPGFPDRILQSPDPPIVQMLSKSCPKVAGKWPGDINTEMATKIVPVRAVNLSTGPFCTEFRCEQLCDEDIFRDRGQLLGPETGLRDINAEIFTKMVPMRAVDLSIGPFCTEFRCECFCDDATF